MTLTTLPIDSIVIERESRQRRDVSDVAELAASIATHGLINPITVDHNCILIAGERRLEACKSLGHTEILVRFFEELSPTERKLIELEENVRRVDLPWKDYVNSIAEIHQIYAERKPDWTQFDTAGIIGMSATHVQDVLLIHRNFNHELVQNADKFSVARGVARRYEERKSGEAKRDLSQILEASLGLPLTPAPPQKSELRSESVATSEPRSPQLSLAVGDFRTVLDGYSGPPFNFLHCDLPYGVNTGDKSGQSAAKTIGHYDDSPEIYFELLNDLILLTPKIIAPSAHMMFWFSMDFYNETKELLENAGWRVLARPLIWHKSNNAGILPDPNRGPRQTYESAFFCSRGDRLVVRAVANSFASPTIREFHTSEKPRGVLEHFFRMFVDDNTRLLDPTAGSGNAIKVSSQLGAEYALGIERDPYFAAGARTNLGLDAFTPE